MLHPSAFAEMSRCVDAYLPTDRRSVVVDLGSYTSANRQEMTHRRLLADHDCEIIGVDIRPGLNVDRVMEEPYRLPMRAATVDVVMSGQVFEHIPFFWATMLEIARVLKTGGHFFMTAPSRGHQHTSVDCWRYYPDGVRAMAAFSGLEVVEVRTDFPPTVGDADPGSLPAGVRPRQHDFAAIDMANRYWGDTVAVLRKPRSYPALRLAVVRPPLLWWANRSAGAALPPRARKEATAGSDRAESVRSVVTATRA